MKKSFIFKATIIIFSIFISPIKAAKKLSIINKSQDTAIVTIIVGEEKTPLLRNPYYGTNEMRKRVKPGQTLEFNHEDIQSVNISWGRNSGIYNDIRNELKFPFVLTDEGLNETAAISKKMEEICDCICCNIF